MTNQELKLLAEKADALPILEELTDEQAAIAEAFMDAAANPKTVLDLLSQIERLQKFAAFAACTIRSGEPWTSTCQQKFDEAIPPKTPEETLS